MVFFGCAPLYHLLCIEDYRCFISSQMTDYLPFQCLYVLPCEKLKSDLFLGKLMTAIDLSSTL